MECRDKVKNLQSSLVAVFSSNATGVATDGYVPTDIKIQLFPIQPVGFKQKLFPLLV